MNPILDRIDHLRRNTVHQIRLYPYAAKGLDASVGSCVGIRGRAPFSRAVRGC
jgi:hypothetical protein